MFLNGGNVSFEDNGEVGKMKMKAVVQLVFSGLVLLA